MSTKHRTPKKSETANTIKEPTSYIPAVISLLILAGFVGYWFTQRDSDSGVLVPQETVVAETTLPLPLHNHTLKTESLSREDSAVREVASYFQCGCGNCDDLELSTCQCPSAKAQREFIQKHLKEGKEVDTVRFLVYKTYGYEKPQYTTLFQSMK